jgi:exonuclease III
VKLATFNVNGVNGRLPILLRWLQQAAPDIVCLQELKAPQDRFPEEPIRQAGYGAIWHGQTKWNGVAILARGKDPIETRRGRFRCPLGCQAATPNSVAMNRAWALMSRAPMFRTCPFLIIAIAS